MESLTERDELLVEALNECISLGITIDELSSVKDKLAMLTYVLNNLKSLEEKILMENERDRISIEEELGIADSKNKKIFKKEILKKIETESLSSNTINGKSYSESLCLSSGSENEHG
jgi:hypothetical protein